MEIKRFDSPDETRTFQAKGNAEILMIGGRKVVRSTHEPGWRWSEHNKPIAGTDSCQAPHLAYIVSGRLRVMMDDGSDYEIGAGDVVAIPSGHDAETIGDEPCVMIDFGA